MTSSSSSGPGPLLSVRAGHRAAPRSTVKLNIMPLCMCSAMWQWAIHRPGLVTSNRMSTVCPVRTRTVSFQTRLVLRRSVAGQDEEAPGAVQVERVVHRVVGVHLVDQSDLDPVSDGEPPVDRGCRGAGGPIHEFPVHVGRGGQPVDLHHVVFPFDAVGCSVLVAPAPDAGERSAALGRARGISSVPWRSMPSCSCRDVHAVSRIVAVLMVRVAGRCCGACGRSAGMGDRGPAASSFIPHRRAASRLARWHYRVHRTGVADLGRRHGRGRGVSSPHREQRPGWSLVTSGCIGQA